MAMVTEPFASDPTLEALKCVWPAALWEQRLAEAQVRLATIEAVEAAIASGMSEVRALVEVGGSLHRSTYRGQLRRLQVGGLAALFNKRPPPPPEELKATPAVKALICAMRLADPNVGVERIAEVLASRFETTLSPTVIKRVLGVEGLNRSPGGKRFLPAKPTEEELLFAGAEFFRMADEELGYGPALAEVITTCAREIAAASPRPETPSVAVGRDERGHFTAESNAANAKGEESLGPAFRSIDDKRRESDLGARRLASAAPATVADKVTAVLALPYLTDTGRAVGIDTYRARTGIVEACGTAYASSTLDRFLRDAKYLGLGQPLVEFHAGFWQAHEPVADTKAAAMCIYLDASNKALWTNKFTRCGKVSSNGRVMPCLEQAFLHTGMGTPLYFQTFSGHESLVKQAMPLLAKTEALVGSDWMAGRILVIDGEGAAMDLLRQLDAAGREYVTILREGQVSGPEVVRDLTAWVPHREFEEIAEGNFTLGAKGKTPYDVRVVLLRRVRAGQLTVLATSVKPETFDASEVADAYFDRWPKQERRFRTFSQGAHFKRIHGYGKQLVTNIAVVNKLDKLAIQRKRVDKRRETLDAVLIVARKARQKARRAVNLTKARRKLSDNRVAFELSAKRPNPKVVAARVEEGHAERDRSAQAHERLRLADEAVVRAEAEEVVLKEKAAELAERATELESRRTIYQADTELDMIMTAFKLGFVLVAEAALRMYFGGMRMSLDGFIRHILTIPGTRITDTKTVTIRFKPSPDKKVQAALVAACARVTAFERRRDGKLLRMEVEDPVDRKQRSKGAS